MSAVFAGWRKMSAWIFEDGSGRKENMLIGYMRASKVDGSEALDLQRDALLAAGVEPANIYEDMAPAQDNRPGLAKCLKSLRKGHVLVIWKLDRLARSTRHLIETVDDLTKRGVGFKVLQALPSIPPRLSRWLNSSAI